MKKRILTISLIVASLVLLVSVGFAGWVIQGNMSDSKSGNFTAYSVQNNGQIIVSDVSGSIIFGAPDTPATPAGDAWFTFASMDAESLSVTFTVQLDGVSSAKFTLTPSHSAGTLDSYLIGGPTFTASGAASVPTSGDDQGKLVFTSEGTATVTVTYSWGTLFGGNNPYAYFYSHKSDKSTVLAGTDLTNAQASNLTYGGNAISSSNNVTYAKLAELAMNYIYTVNGGTFTVAIAKVN